jgi:DNA-binding MarR family transcriptional regulator
MAELDPDLQQPTRLRLLTMLTAVSAAEFTTLRDHLDVSDSVLSKHITALTSLEYLKSRKGVHAGRRTTWISLTPTGRTALSEHAQALRDIIANVQ